MCSVRKSWRSKRSRGPRKSRRGGPPCRREREPRAPTRKREGRNDEGHSPSLTKLSIFFERLEMRVEPKLCNERGHDCAADHCRHKNCVLLLVDDVIGQAEQGRDRPESETGGHHQRGVHALTSIELEIARQRQDTSKLGDHLHREEQRNQPRTSEERVRVDK